MYIEIAKPYMLEIERDNLFCSVCKVRAPISERIISYYNIILFLVGKSWKDQVFSCLRRRTVSDDVFCNNQSVLLYRDFVEKNNETECLKSLLPWNML